MNRRYVIIPVLICMLVFVPTAFAAAVLNMYSWANANPIYYNDDNAPQPASNSAIGAWNKQHPTKVKFTYTTDSKKAKLKFKTTTSSLANWVGLADWNSKNSGSFTISSATITLNKNSMYSNIWANKDDARGVVGHELGHVLGLDDRPAGIKELMNYLTTGEGSRAKLKVYEPTDVEKAGIRKIYK